MNITAKSLLLVSLVLGVVSCTKDEPTVDDFNTGYYDPFYPSKMKINTPKGSTLCELVNKNDLPAWIQNQIDGIHNGYVMKAGAGEETVYFIYDEEKMYGRHYDAQGNTTKPNPELKDWVVIYLCRPNFVIL